MYEEGESGCRIRFCNPQINLYILFKKLIRVDKNIFVLSGIGDTI